MSDLKNRLIQIKSGNRPLASYLSGEAIEEILSLVAEVEQAAVLRGGVRALRNLAEGFEGVVHPQASRVAEVIERYARQLELQATKPEKEG